MFENTKNIKMIFVLSQCKMQHITLLSTFINEHVMSLSKKTATFLIIGLRSDTKIEAFVNRIIYLFIYLHSYGYFNLNSSISKNSILRF